MSLVRMTSSLQLEDILFNWQKLKATEWRIPTGCLKMHVISRKRATNYRALSRKMTHKDKAPYGPCSRHSQKSDRYRVFWECLPNFYQLKRMSSSWRESLPAEENVFQLKTGRLSSGTAYCMWSVIQSQSPISSSWVLCHSSWVRCHSLVHVECHSISISNLKFVSLVSQFVSHVSQPIACGVSFNLNLQSQVRESCVTVRESCVTA